MNIGLLMDQTRKSFKMFFLTSLSKLALKLTSFVIVLSTVNITITNGVEVSRRSLAEASKIVNWNVKNEWATL
jgi:hypothetical protein